MTQVEFLVSLCPNSRGLGYREVYDSTIVRKSIPLVILFLYRGAHLHKWKWYRSSVKTNTYNNSVYHLHERKLKGNIFRKFQIPKILRSVPGTLRKISGMRKFGQKILSKMREHVHRKFQDPHFSNVTASQK